MRPSEQSTQEESIEQLLIKSSHISSIWYFSEYKNASLSATHYIIIMATLEMHFSFSI